MPIAGGIAGKKGDFYESLWVVDHLLKIVRGDALGIIYESFDKIESKGVEFIISFSNQKREYWSIKRQISDVEDWTLAKLTQCKKNNRSILGDLIEHVKREQNNYAVFASTLGSKDLQELCENANNLDERLSRSKDLKQNFEEKILPLFGDNTNAKEGLKWISVRTIDKEQLKERINADIQVLFYDYNQNNPIEPLAIRGYLIDFIKISLRNYTQR